MDDEPSARREPGVASVLGPACSRATPVAATPVTAQDNTAPTVTAAQTTLARWCNEIARRFSRSDAGGARGRERGRVPQESDSTSPPTRLLADSGAAGMKSDLRSAAIALLLLASLFGVCEAARAQTVIWSATLEAGSSGSNAGYHHLYNYGSLSSRNFAYKGKSFTVDSFYTNASPGVNITYFHTSSGGPRINADLFGDHTGGLPTALHVDDHSWRATTDLNAAIFSSTVALLYEPVFVDGNTYSVSITTTEPGQPRSLEVTNPSLSEVTLNWEAPIGIGGSAIRGYKYRYKTRGAKEFGDWTAIPGSAGLTSYVVGGLEEDTEYTFQMLGTNDSGDGLYSGEVTGSTLAAPPTVILVLDRNRISENNGESTVTALLDRASSAATTVTVSASPVSPAKASDFKLSSNKVLTIAAEQTTSTGTVTITAVDNDDDDDNRQVTVSGVAENADGVTQPSSPTLTIADDESASTKVTLTVSPTSVAEDATGADRTVTVTAELDGDPLPRTTEVTVSVSGDTAVAGTDYTAVPSFTFSIEAGDTSGTGTFTLAPIDDNLDEPDVTVAVTGTTTSGLSVEPESGLTVKIEGDDDAPAVTLVLDPSSIAEDRGVSTVTATLDRPSTEDVSIAVSASPVSPAEPGDFTLNATKTLTITAGQTTSTGAVTITANDNNVAAPDKRVTVSGAATSEADLTAPQDVTLTIVDDEEASTVVTLTVDRTTVAEDAAASARTVTVTATLNETARPQATPVTVSVSGGTAAAGTDYSAVENFTVTIDAGKTSGAATFTLTPVDDEVDEPDKTVVVTGTTTASGLSVAPADGVTVTITDDDPRPKPALELTHTSISEDGGVSTVTATLDRPSSAVTTITVSHAPVSPTSSSDFTRSGSTLTIAPGDTASTGTVTITGRNNNTHQPISRAVVVIGSAANSQGVRRPDNRLLTIVEDDVASTKVTLSVSPASVSEGGGAGTVTVTATLDEAARPSGTPVRVSVSGNSAVAGTDFSTVEDFTIRIRPNQTSGSGTFTLTPVDDEVDEPHETVTVTGTTPDSVGLPVEPASGVTVTIADDDEAPLGTLALSVDAIATDGTVNIAEKTAGFAISGATGSEAGVAVSVTMGSQSPLTATSDGNGAWSVSVPANATYITGTSVAVSVSASKTGYTSPDAVTRTLAVDLAAPSVSYTAPASLKVGVAISAVTPSTADTDIASYSATGLPSGLTIHSGTGAISGTPDTAAANAATATVTVTDTAGNPTTVSLAFPAVDKGDQTLTGFAYSPDTVTFGNTAPTVTAPSGAQTTLEYSATPSTVCTVDSGTGALTLAGVGSCVVTVTAESSANYNQATATFTVTVQDTLALSVAAIATDNTVNIAEKTAGFAISGTTGSEGGVSVTVTVGSMELSATSAETDPATWSVTVLANAAYITGTSVNVSVSASKTGFAAPSPVTRTLAVDLAAPSVSYTAPASLKVGVAITAMTPTTADTDIASYSATGLPSGLTIHSGTGAISGTPDTAAANAVSVTVTVTDSAGNPTTVSLAFPAVDKGDQTLTGFAYSTDTVTFGDTAPSVTAPSGAHTTLAYTATPSSVCSVDSGTGALTLAGVGSCVVTVTAESSANYNQATATFTVTVQDTLALSVDAIATDGTVNIAEKAAGFAISGTTGSEGGVSVTVTVGSMTLTATSAETDSATWSVSVPANAAYITGTSVAVSASASKTGFTAPSPVTRSLAVDLAAPSVSYTAPASLKVDVAITAVTPTTADTDIASYSATGLPSGLTIHSGTGAISGTPDTAAANAVSVTVTVTVTDLPGGGQGRPDPDRVRLPPCRRHRLPGGGQGRPDPDRVRLQPRHGDLRRHRPTVTAPTGAQTTLAYTATPSTVCTVDSGTGALTLAGVGSCVVTVTAESSANYNQATATFTVTVQDTLALSVAAIATDNTVNIAEKTAGFAISGTTGSEGGVSVTVTVGSMELSATSAETDPATWSVTVLANAAYITGTSVNVSVSASKTGFAAPSPVTRTLAVDLAAPSVSYTAPASLKVGVAITAMTPTTADTDIASYSATGLPSGLTIHSGTGAISGTPDTAAANAVSVTVTVTDTAGNPTDVSITFPTVDKGDQTLTGFAYSPDTVTFGDTAPTVTAPSGAQTTLEYSAAGALTLAGVGECVITVTAESSDNSTVCTVDSGTGALTLAGVRVGAYMGECVITVTAE